MERLPDSRDRSLSVWMHLSALLGFIFPAGNIIAPLIIWSIRRDYSEMVDENGKSSINFQITWSIVLFFGWLIWFVIFLGGIIFSAVGLADNEPNETLIIGAILSSIFYLIPLGLVHLTKFILMIIGALQAGEGKVFNYPLTFRFFR